MADHTLENLINLNVTDEISARVATFVINSIQPSTQSSPHPIYYHKSSCWTKIHQDCSLMPLQHFIMTVARGSRSKAATMLIAIIYLNRLREKIGFRLEPGGPACACHRVAFAAIMISHKLWNDVTFIGKQWAQMSNMFDAKDVLSMERELLTLLKYDLKLSMIDISRFSSVIFPSLVSFVHRPLNFHYSPPTAYIETNHASTHVYPSIPVWGPRFHSNMAHIPPPG